MVLDENEKEMMLTDLSKIQVFLRETINAFKKYGVIGMSQEWAEWLERNKVTIGANLAVTTQLKKELYKRHSNEINDEPFEWEAPLLKAMALRGIKENVSILAIAIRKNPICAISQELVNKGIIDQYALGDSFRVRFPYERWEKNLNKLSRSILEDIKVKQQEKQQEVSENE